MLNISKQDLKPAFRVYHAFYCLVLLIGLFGCGNDVSSQANEELCTAWDRHCKSDKEIVICNESGNGWHLYTVCEENEVCCLGVCEIGSSCNDLVNGDLDVIDLDAPDSTDIAGEVDLENSEEAVDVSSDNENDLDDTEEERDILDTAMEMDQDTDEFEREEQSSEEDSAILVCPADVFGDNHSLENAYRLLQESQTLEDVMICYLYSDWYVMYIDEGTTLMIETDPGSIENNSIHLYRMDEDDELEILRSSSSIPDEGIARLLFNANVSDEYFFKIDRLNDNVLTTIDISINSNPAVEGDYCEIPWFLDITEQEPQFMTAGPNFITMANSTSGSCVGADGRDMAFEFEIENTTDVNIKVRSDFDVGVYLRSSCSDSTTEVSCVDIEYIVERLQLQLEPEIYYLFVDAYEADQSGWFEISITTTESN